MSAIKALLIALSCADCGICEQACMTGSPRRRIREAVKVLFHLKEPEELSLCNACGRCTVFCPLSIPTFKLTMMVKSKILVPEDLERLRLNARETGHSLAIPPSMREMWFQMIKNYVEVKVDEPAEWLYVPAALDVMPSEFDSASSVLWLLNKLGIDFTLSKEVIESGANWFFDYFDHDKTVELVTKMIIKADELGAKGIIIGECGSDYKLLPRIKEFVKIKHNLKVVPLVKVLYDNREVIEKSIKRKLKGKVCYHDPCGLGRYNFLIKEPRELVKMIVEDFDDREPKGMKQLCCGGGGGGSLSPYMKERYIELIGKRKMKQYDGCDVILTACAKCKNMLATYSLTLKTGIKVIRLSKAIAWAMGFNVPI